MALGDQVLGLLDELRSTKGTLRRARVVGRLAGAARRLSKDERKELASILADRYAPRVAERLADGRDVESADLLAMVRAVGRVDADEIAEIMEQIRNPGERRALLADVAEGLRDDVAGADVDTLIDDPGAAIAAIASATLGSDDPERTEPETEAVPPAPSTTVPEVVDTDGPGGGTVPPPRPEAEGGDQAAQQDLPSEPPAGRPDAPAVPAEAVAAIEAEPRAGTDDAPDASPEPAPTGEMPEPPAPVSTAAGLPVPAPPEPEPPAAMPPDLIEHIRVTERPVTRLRLLRTALTRWVGASAALELAALFPDGWQRRRAVGAMLGAMTTPDVPEAGSVLSSLGRPADRRWLVRTLCHSWNLSADEAAQLGAAAGIDGASRVARSGESVHHAG